MDKIVINPFEKFYKQWALVTAGTKEKFNSMTIGWGTMGTLWSTPVVTIFIKPVRYTWEFVEKSDYFTVSFFENKYKKALGIMGSKSGRDCDKVKLSGLTPKFLENGITYEEATETFVCKKIYCHQMDKDKFPELAKKFYERKGEEPAYNMIIGELVKV